MKIGMKEDMGVADKMTVKFWIVCRARNFAQSAPKHTYLQFIMAGRVSRSTHNYASAPQCTYLQFMLLEGKDCD